MSAVRLRGDGGAPTRPAPRAAPCPPSPVFGTFTGSGHHRPPQRTGTVARTRSDGRRPPHPHDVRRPRHHEARLGELHALERPASRHAASRRRTDRPGRRPRGPRAGARRKPGGQRPGTGTPGPTVDRLPARELLEHAPALTALLHGPDHRLLHVNEAYRTAFGAPPDEATGTPAQEALPELAALGLLPLLDQVHRSGRPARSSPARPRTAAATPSPARPSPYRPRPRTDPRTPRSSSSPPTSPTTPKPPNASAPANGASARPPSRSSAPCSRRNSNSPTTCASPPPTSPEAPKRRSAATGTT